MQRRAGNALQCVVAAAALACATTPAACRAEAVPVELRESEQGWTLLRGGEPYLIRGAGGDAPLEKLAAAGANSVRTWGADDLDGLLDKAHVLGLTVTVGIWLGHTRHGFDYNDPLQLEEQMDRARRTVMRYKDHPAILLWGIGNEMEGFGSGDEPAIWSAVNAVAAMVKAVDPLHPTMTVTAEIGGGRIDAIHRRSPAIDIHGINSYAGAVSLRDRLRQGGATKPFVLTEFGPPGSWESETTDWGAPIELSSTEKARHYREAYEQSVVEADGMSLGSYAFAWGAKMEATATWFGMFLDDGSKLAAVDTMTELWSGEKAANLAPSVSSIALAGGSVVKPAAMVVGSVEVHDPEGAALRARWALRRESGDYLTGGDFRPVLPDIANAVVDAELQRVSLRMPTEPGAYRLFYYVHDPAGGAATANVPLRVEGTVRKQFPIHVYHDGFEGMPWVPSGWMGATSFLTLDGQHSADAHEGDSSIRLRYTGKYGWAGVAWQHPANNWGNQDGGFDVSGADVLSLWARGEYGGEQVRLGVGLLDDDVGYPDSAVRAVEGITLSHEWRRYVVPLRGADLSSIKTGFVITVTGRETPVTVYLDSIRFERSR